MDKRMFKATTLSLLLGVMAGCGSTPATSDDDGVKPATGGCYQSQWQAESVPVVGKRMGAEALEKYEPEQQAKAPGCP